MGLSEGVAISRRELASGGSRGGEGRGGWAGSNERSEWQWVDKRGCAVVVEGSLVADAVTRDEL